MYNSILHFNEFGVKEIEKVIKNFMMDENKNIGDLVMELDKPLQELQREIMSFVKLSDPRIIRLFEPVFYTKSQIIRINDLDYSNSLKPLKCEKKHSIRVPINQEL